MVKYRCLSCGGEYDPDQPGGYYHVCPPYRLVPKGAGGPGIVAGDPGPYDDVTRIEQYEVIATPRNENVDDTDPAHPVKPKFEGRGRETVAVTPVEVGP